VKLYCSWGAGTGKTPSIPGGGAGKYSPYGLLEPLTLGEEQDYCEDPSTRHTSPA